MRHLLPHLFAAAVVAVVVPAMCAPLVAQQFGPQPAAAEKQALLRLREAAWRTFFANDQDGFKRVVPGELLAMGWDGGSWQDRAQILAGMNEFAKSGQVIEALEFPRTEFQQYGDAVILYTTFRLVLKAPDGKLNETKGRGTEIFVRKAGKWTHTAWHLDTVAN